MRAEGRASDLRLFSLPEESSKACSPWGCRLPASLCLRVFSGPSWDHGWPAGGQAQSAREPLGGMVLRQARRPRRVPVTCACVPASLSQPSLPVLPSLAHLPRSLLALVGLSQGRPPGVPSLRPRAPPATAQAHELRLHPVCVCANVH